MISIILLFSYYKYIPINYYTLLYIFTLLTIVTYIYYPIDNITVWQHWMCASRLRALLAQVSSREEGYSRCSVD